MKLRTSLYTSSAWPSKSFICGNPTLVNEKSVQVPGVFSGSEVRDIPDERVKALYDITPVSHLPNGLLDLMRGCFNVHSRDVLQSRIQNRTYSCCVDIDLRDMIVYVEREASLGAVSFPYVFCFEGAFIPECESLSGWQTCLMDQEA